jgi:diguanylate cyclase (GGDEF)-like protein
VRLARPQPIHLYSGLVFLTGAAVIAALVISPSPVRISHAPVQFWIFAAVVMLGELLPVSIPRQDDDIQITVSTTFAFAILLAYGTTPAVLVFAAASVIGDMATRLAWYKVLLNLGQYALAMAACGLLLDATIGLGGGLSQFSTIQLLWVAVAGCVFFVVNVAALAAFLVLRHDAQFATVMRNEIPFHALITGSLLAIGPTVVVVAEHNPALVPVIFIPTAIAHRTAVVSREKEHQSLHDDLTGLPNRTLFFRRVQAALVDARLRSGSSAVMIVDLDHFKEINDTLGHHVGDLLLRDAGVRIQSMLGEADTVARLGGDEFGVLLHGVLERAEVESVAARIVAALEQPFTIDSTRLDVGASIGSAMFPEHGDDADTLIQRADIAMYVAKVGHGDHVVYSSIHDQHSPERLALVGELRQAIIAESLLLYYQPKVGVAGKQVLGLEALARWIHPDRGFIPPDEFIPLAERTGLIAPLTTMVIEKTLQQIRGLHRDGHQVSIAVNISARILRDDGFPGEVERLLAEAGVESRWLHLELTESMVMEDPERAVEILGRLSAMGISLSIDDFGTGYSSMAHLKRLPVDEIKIDKSFVLDMAVDASDAVIARSIIDLGHNLGLSVVAEGVETPEVLAQLETMGCDQVQGYLFSRPLPAEDVSRWLSGWQRRRLLSHPELR